MYWGVSRFAAAPGVCQRTFAPFGKQRVNGLAVVVAVLLAVVHDYTSPACGQSVIAKSVSVPAAMAPIESSAVAKSSTGLEQPSPTADEIATETESAVLATAISVNSDSRGTTFKITLSRPVSVQAFTLAGPYRVIIDMPDVAFRLPEELGSVGQGLVTGYRHGLFAVGRSRVVIDTTGPVRVVSATVVPSPAGAMLHVRMEPTTAMAFAATASDSRQVTPGWRPAAATAPPQLPSAPQSAGKFVVMIDPGHGGADAGAVGPNRLAEKDIVLAVARQLKSVLDARGKYDVRMTRSTDTFVQLERRVALSEAAGAQLFISLHADAVGDPQLALTAHGATVYTLSEQASNGAAAALAEKENAADGAGGMAQAGDAESIEINGILADLMKRETSNFSTEFQQLLLDRMRPSQMLARDPARSAAFRVLRQMPTPTVLIELGFISNQTDAETMQLAEWQKKVAATIAGAVDTFAANRRNHVALKP